MILRWGVMAAGAAVIAGLLWWGVSSWLDDRDENAALRATAQTMQADKAATDTAQATLNEKKKELDHARTEREATLDGAADLPDADFWRILGSLLDPYAAAGGGDASGQPHGSLPGTAEQWRGAEAPASR